MYLAMNNCCHETNHGPDGSVLLQDTCESSLSGGDDGVHNYSETNDEERLLNSSVNDGGPLILKPFPPAMDPRYSVFGPVGEGTFVLSRSGPPTPEELSNEQILLIVRDGIATDLEVNTLVWKCLGYRFDTINELWEATEVFPNWKECFPNPPDLIGMRREYSKEIDSPSLRSNQALVKSIPMEFKQSLKTHLRPLGWTGYQYRELTVSMLFSIESTIMTIFNLHSLCIHSNFINTDMTILS